MDSNNNAQLEKEKNKCLVSNASTSSIDSQSSSISAISQDIDDTSFNNVEENTSYIKEVFAPDYKKELKKIFSIIDKGEYTYIGMDTEFPGNVCNINSIDNDFYYKNMKLNVDSTKIIQLGITLTNEKGEYPQNLPYHTWQFNFKFDLKNDKFSEESINLLKSSGINFENLEKNGINQKKFVKELMNSALVLNPKVKWVSYHGAYDFAYLLKLLNRDILPNTEQEFIETLKVFIPEFYDIKMLIKDIDMYFNGGLNRLIYNLDIERKGINHQAGSDSIATIESFHKLIKNESITQIKMEKYKNVLYGIGLGKDNKNTIKYINNKCNNIVNNLNVNNVNEQKINNNTVFNRNMMYFNNQSINQIKQINNACNNYMKCFYPYFLVNTFNAVKNNFYQMNFSRTMMA